MDMTRLTTEAQQLIARKELGTPLHIYAPPTTSIILVSIILLGTMLGFAALMGAVFSSVYVFIFFGLLLAILPLSIIGVALSNRKKRAVVCTLGVALLLPKGSESFRWEDVLTTTHMVASRGGLTYTVHCHDGRRIVFRDFSHIRDLAETINVQVAHAQHPRRYHEGLGEVLIRRDRSSYLKTE